MNITRIKPPKFKIGRYVLNEYEMRQFMLEVAQGKRKHGVKISNMYGESAIILPNGRLDLNIRGFSIATDISIEHFRLRVKKREAS